MILHSFVNIFAGGRSDTKAILFVCYLTILFLFFIFFKKNIKKISFILGFVFLSLLFSYGVISHLMISDKFNLATNSFVIIGNNSEISSTTLSHIHETKGVIGFGLSFLGINTLQKSDAGSVFIGLLPTWWLGLGLFLLISCLLLCLVYFLNLLKYFHFLNKFKKSALIFWYSVVSFSLVKNSVDGGILSPIILSLLFSITLFLFIKNNLEKRYHSFLLVFFLSITGLLFCILNPNSSIYLLLGQIIGTILLLSTFTMLIFGAPKKFYYFISIVLFLISWNIASSRDRAIFNYSQININKSEQYVSYNTQDHSIEDKVSDINTNIRKIAKQQNKNVSYKPISVIGKTCNPNGYPIFSEFIIKTQTPFKDIDKGYLKIFIKESALESNLWISKVIIFAEPCLPEPLTIIDDVLKENGFKFYILVNPYFL